MFYLNVVCKYVSKLSKGICFVHILRHIDYQMHCIFDVHGTIFCYPFIMLKHHPVVSRSISIRWLDYQALGLTALLISVVKSRLFEMHASLRV